jgi:sugar phosphate isomerase/epimerase
VRNRGIKLGYDNFAVRAMKWKAPALIDYAAQMKTDSLFITDLMAFESFEDAYLNDLRKKAADVGVQIVLGSWSICPTSKSFKDTWGTAVEHGALTMRMAKALGSPAARFILGAANDRKTPGGIQARIADTVTVCKELKPYYENLGVKIAIENHAGDMQSAELVELIEAAGKEYVGANMDTGNGMWTLEDPLVTLNNLAPYVLTTSLRDTMLWESPNGATAQWVAMGDGVVDFATFFDLFEKKCPGVAVHIETIGGFNKEINYLEPGFFDLYPKQTPSDLAAWLRLARKGKALTAGKGSFASDQEFQKDQIERSIAYCRNALGLGPKA